MGPGGGAFHEEVCDGVVYGELDGAGGVRGVVAEVGDERDFLHGARLAWHCGHIAEHGLFGGVRKNVEVETESCRILKCWRIELEIRQIVVRECADRLEASGSLGPVFTHGSDEDVKNSSVLQNCRTSFQL